MQNFDENADGQEFEVHSSEIFEIALPENPTTGFRWSFETNGGPFCLLLDDHFVLTTQSLPGQGGRHYWHFKAVQVGSGNITAISRRSWEQAERPARKFTLRVHVVA